MKYSNLFFILALCTAFFSCATGSGVLDTFTVDSRARSIPIGEIEFQTDTFMGFGKLKKTAAIVSYFPKDDAVCVQYRYNLTTYNQFWSRRGRLIFQSALENYNIDYNARSLSISEKKAKEKYGKTNGYLVWQQSSFLTRAEGSMSVNFGYTFKDRSPFFIVHQLDAKYVDEKSSDDNRTSEVIQMYFTRAQAADLAALFNQEFLSKFSAQNAVNHPPVEIINEEYDDYPQE